MSEARLRVEESRPTNASTPPRGAKRGNPSLATREARAIFREKAGWRGQPYRGYARGWASNASGQLPKVSRESQRSDTLEASPR